MTIINPRTLGNPELHGKGGPRPRSEEARLLFNNAQSEAYRQGTPLRERQRRADDALFNHPDSQRLRGEQQAEGGGQDGQQFPHGIAAERAKMISDWEQATRSKYSNEEITAAVDVCGQFGTRGLRDFFDHEGAGNHPELVGFCVRIAAALKGK